MSLLKNNNLIFALCKLQFVPLAAVQEFSVGQDGFTKQIVADFSDCYGTPGTMLFTQQQQPTPAGSQYSQEVNLSYPGLEKENIPLLYNLDQDQYLVKITTTAGQEFIMGSPEAGAKLTWQHSTSTGGFSINFNLIDCLPIGTNYIAPGAFNIAFSSGFTIGFK